MYLLSVEDEVSGEDMELLQRVELRASSARQELGSATVDACPFDLQVVAVGSSPIRAETGDRIVEPAHD